MKKKNGFILLPTLLLIQLLLVTHSLLTQSTLIQSQSLQHEYYKTKVYFHAISTLPYLKPHIPQIPLMQQDPKKKTLYSNTSYPLYTSLESTQYLTKTNTHIYCITILNSNARLILKISYTNTENNYHLHGWETL